MMFMRRLRAWLRQPSKLTLTQRYVLCTASAGLGLITYYVLAWLS